MRIGVDLQVLGQKPWTGVGKYAWNLAQALLKVNTKHEFVFFAPGIREIGEIGEIGGEIIALPRKTLPFWSAHVRYARIMRKARLDVLHGPANVLPLFYPSRPAFWRGTLPSKGEGGKVVITLHDLAIYRHPEWFPRGQWFSTRIVVPRSIRKADAIIVPSEGTKEDVMELFGVEEEKVRVVAHGVEDRFYGEIRGIGEIGTNKYILFVGTVEPRKNVGRLIEAYEGLPEEIKAGYELVIAGKGNQGDWGNGGNRDEKGVRWLDYVPDADLSALYQNASVFVYPSLYEGFGLPVLEAMAAGIPVITSKGTAMEEIFTPSLPLPTRGREIKDNSSPLVGEARWGGGGSCALLIDPYSVPSIRAAILKLLRDSAYSSQISARGQELARQYTWERAAFSTLRVYETL